jgi:hypothetical protein
MVEDAIDVSNDHECFTQQDRTSTKNRTLLMASDYIEDIRAHDHATMDCLVK